MNAAAWRAAFRRQLNTVGETITLRRLNPSPAAPTDISVRARVVDYTPGELVGGVVQGDRQILVMADDVTFSPALKRGDKALVRGRLLNIEAVDDNTMRVGADLVAYKLQARG